jgi:hypothetical protein
LNCHLHPEVAAATTCVGCAEAFCENCFVTIGGQDYCAVCKTMAISPGVVPATAKCKDARDALKLALLGFVCFGIVVEPIAIAKALKAKTLIKNDPSLSGKGVADASLFVAVCGLLLWLVGMFSKFKR